MIRIYTDAAVSGQESYAGIGLLIIDGDKQIQLKIPLSGNDWNNHQAEFEAVIYGLKYLIDQHENQQMVFCYTDSQIVVDSIKKNHVKNKQFKEYLKTIQHLMNDFLFINIEWTPQSKNKGADNLAKQALQEAINNA